MKYIYMKTYLLTYLITYLLTYLLIYFLTSESLNLKGYIVNIDTERPFHYWSHSFLLACLKKYGYGIDFIKSVEITWMPGVLN